MSSIKIRSKDETVTKSGGPYSRSTASAAIVAVKLDLLKEEVIPQSTEKLSISQIVAS
jgi:hypothetical protein